MIEPVIYTAIYKIDIDLNIDICFLDSRILTTKKLNKIDVNINEVSKGNYLCIIIKAQLDDFESLTDCAAFVRPRLLIIFGILSFLSRELFMPFGAIKTSTEVLDIKLGKSKKFKIDKIDFLPQFEKIVKFIKNSPENEIRLFYSLIDRYRKAIYLEYKGGENMVHDDEILLSHFHILELLSNNYYTKQKQLASQLINQFTETILKDVYLIEGNQLQAQLNSKRKFVESLFLSELPVGSKIMFMFQEQGILTKRLKSFISELIKDRNSVAHGRQVYQERVVFPVPPFFPIISNRSYSFEMLKLLSGRAIALFINIDYLKNEWEEMDGDIMPTYEELSLFINEKKYKLITIDEFYLGKENDITPYTISYYLLIKKLDIRSAIQVLSEVILNYREFEEEITQIVLAVILIVDGTENDLRAKCIDIIKLSSAMNWLPNWFNMRDTLYFLEYLGHSPKALREMFVNHEI